MVTKYGLFLIKKNIFVEMVGMYLIVSFQTNGCNFQLRSKKIFFFFTKYVIFFFL